MDAALLTLLNQHVTIEPVASLDGYGQQGFGTGVVVDCLIVQKNNVVRDAQGVEVVSSTQLWLDGTVSVTAQDRLTLPDGSHPVILAVQSMPDIDGTIHHKVVFT
jgi:hypothetical protein